jgi:predicted ATPase with chaperone activity
MFALRTETSTAPVRHGDQPVHLCTAAESPLTRPPGAGTSMLARRLTTILPAMTLAEAIETPRIHRVAGLTGDRTTLVMTRPCRAPHHTISDVGLIGGTGADATRGVAGPQWRALSG